MDGGGASSMLHRYKWDDLTDPEKEAVSDAVKIAATRSGVGLGAVLTAAAIVSNARRGKPPLPPLVRYGSLTSFSIAGAYLGFLSAGPVYATRILSVPNSKLAEDLRIVAGDWQARVPTTAPPQELEPHEPLPDPRQPGKGAEDPQPVTRRRPASHATDAAKVAASPKSWTYWIGLTKS